MRKAGLYALVAVCALSACTSGSETSATAGPRGSSSELTPSTPVAASPTFVDQAVVADPIRVDLGNPSAKRSAPGRRLVFGTWGEAADDFGLYPDVPRGPTSFDVAPDGRLVITDQQNHRLVLVDGKNRTNLPVGLPPLYLDLAVTNHEADILVINGGRAGNDLLKRYGLDGSHLGTSVVGNMVGNVGIFNNALLLYTYPPDPNAGWARPDAPPGSAASETPTPTGGQISLAGGRGHHVTITRSEATSTNAWTLTSDANLGVVAMAATGKGVHAVLVHWTNTQRVYQFVDLAEQGLVSQFTLPDDHYAEMTVGSTFRFSGDTLYRAASTPTGFGIFSYSLHANRGSVPPQPSSNRALLDRALGLLEAAGVHDAAEAEPSHGSRAESLWGTWHRHQVRAGVIPTEFAAPPQDLVRTYKVSGTEITVLRSAPYIVHQFNVGDDRWSIVCCSTVDCMGSDDAATTSLVREMIEHTGS